MPSKQERLFDAILFRHRRLRLITSLNAPEAVIRGERRRLKDEMRQLARSQPPRPPTPDAAWWPTRRHRRKVERLAKLLKVSPELAARALMKAWKWAAPLTDAEGLVHGQTVDAINAAAGVPDFTEAAFGANLLHAFAGNAIRFVQAPVDRGNTNPDYWERLLKENGVKRLRSNGIHVSRK